MNEWRVAYMYWVDDFLFWQSCLDWARDLAMRHPGLKAAHEVVTTLKRALKCEQRAYRAIYGELFSIKTIDPCALIAVITNSGYALNEWEAGFIESVKAQGWQLTEKQRTCLVRIYGRSNGRG